MEAAIKECKSYDRMGGLDERVMRDIAHDHDLKFKDLRAAYEESV